MAYSINPLLPKARAAALKLLFLEQLPLNVIALRCGIHRTTLWRWKRKWFALNKNVSQERVNRPRRQTSFQPTYYKWRIVTESSRPQYHPHAMSHATIRRVLAAREKLRRCAEVVWHYLVYGQEVCISLSSVKRIFRRHHVYDRPPKTRRRTYHTSIPRPQATYPGALVQMDTVHLYHPLTKKKYYLYTAIDLYTRMAYARIYSDLRPGIAADVVHKARRHFGFSFVTVQTDHGPEFSRRFKDHLSAQSIQHRHSRLQRPNDNAHIERFNRTVQTECTGSYVKTTESLSSVQVRLAAYLDFYNTKRIHLGLQLQTPVSMLQR